MLPSVASSSRRVVSGVCVNARSHRLPTPWLENTRKKGLLQWRAGAGGGAPEEGRRDEARRRAAAVVAAVAAVVVVVVVVLFILAVAVAVAAVVAVISVVRAVQKVDMKEEAEVSIVGQGLALIVHPQTHSSTIFQHAQPPQLNPFVLCWSFFGITVH